MRKISIFILMLLLTGFLAACGSSASDEPEAAEADNESTTAVTEADESEEASAEAPAEPEEEEAAPMEEAETTEDAVELVLWIMPNGADPQGAIDAEIAEFEAEHPNISVETEVVGWGDAFTRVQTAVQGGDGPCVSQLGSTWVPTFGVMGGLLPFTGDDVATMGGEENFVAASYETGRVEGETVAIPWFADVRAIVYRQDLFEAAGVDLDTAFDDIDSFVAALEQIKEAELTSEDGQPIVPFVHTGRNDWNVWQNASMWMWAYGADLLNEDGSLAAFNTEEAVAGATVYHQLYGKGLTSIDTLELNSAQTDARFGEGNTASFISGPWAISLARDTENSGWTDIAAENFSVAEFPAGPGGHYTFVGGSNLAVMKTCEHPEEALELINYLTSKDSQIRYANAIGMLPTTIEAQSDTSFTEDEHFSVFISAAEKGKSAVNIAEWGQVENNLQTSLQSLWEDVAAAGIGTPIDPATVQARLDEAAETVNSLLE